MPCHTNISLSNKTGVQYHTYHLTSPVSKLMLGNWDEAPFSGQGKYSKALTNTSSSPNRPPFVTRAQLSSGPLVEIIKCEHKPNPQLTENTAGCRISLCYTINKSAGVYVHEGYSIIMTRISIMTM